MHPQLLAQLADERRLCCPCGARTGRPNTLCRKCRHTALYLRHAKHAKHADRAARRLAKRGVRHPPVVLALALFFRGARP